MPITEFLARNASLYGDEISLIERNPEMQGRRKVTWREFELIEPNPPTLFRRHMTWREFDNRANQFANLLLNRGLKRAIR